MSTIFDSRWWLFPTVMLIHAVCHTVDGLILLLIHFRATYLHLKKTTVQVLPQLELKKLHEYIRSSRQYECLRKLLRYACSYNTSRNA
ncbi:hypothetical protein OESDEN_19390 [Oesophagostomum dentatum]|uniref:Uncharacterized protein n=1 Tax=Oesophagostomum dentatum TaxID=61180 RepID=A0A0B1S7L1_OESDE|nr:hypothetical protein OESDEN_19390 [Oesophagostomum dentatum]